MSLQLPNLPVRPTQAPAHPYSAEYRSTRRPQLSGHLPVSLSLFVGRLPRPSRLLFLVGHSLFSRSMSTLQRPGLTRLSCRAVQLPSLFTFASIRSTGGTV